jgi:CRISPR-associated endonuclease/helicase Cas3
VLTHHRLVGAKVLSGGALSPTTEHLVGRFPHDDLDAQIADIFEIPPGMEAPWADAEWCQAVADAASELLASDTQDFWKDFRLSAVYGRTALILGDHKASQDGSSGPSAETPTSAYANTTRDGGKLAEVLGKHLVNVREHAVATCRGLIGGLSDFPGIAQSDLPASISSPADNGGIFAWQAEAAAAIHSVARGREHFGFFGILMAGTGAGKTRAAPIIMAAASEGAVLRLNVCTGLRALTLQAGDEYRTDMGFAPADISVVMGDSLTSALHELAQDDVGGTERAGQGSASIQIDRHLILANDCGSSRSLPMYAQTLVEDEQERANRDLLSSPILVCTIDIMMAAADALRGGHVFKTIRAASCDLVMDEIDSFGDEDVAAIARNVFLSGVFGRKVLISSATVTREIAEALSEAYFAGWNLHCHVSGSDGDVLCGWFSNTAACQVFFAKDSTEFHKGHRSFSTAVVASLASALRKRRARVAEVPVGSVEAYFSQVVEEIRAMHSTNHVVDQETERRISIGVVRWSNVAPSLMFAKRLLEQGVGDGADVFVIPYNGTMLPAWRHRLEQEVNSLLKRNLKDGKDPIFKNRYVRKVLDERTSERDVIIVMVTTSLEEVGRNHDFDWAISEPGSLRGIVQLAGRVLRHREIGASNPNVCILARAFREVVNEVKGRPNGRIFAWPGVETVSKDKTRPVPAALGSHDANDIYDMSLLSERVDASEIVAFDPPASALGAAERFATMAMLASEEAAYRNASIGKYIMDPMASYVTHHPRERRFRRSEAVQQEFFMRIEGGQANWMVRRADTTDHARSCSRNVMELTIKRDRLLFDDFGDVVDMAGELAELIWGKRRPVDAANSLLTITRPMDQVTANTEIIYNQALGFVERRDWIEMD